jgi:Tail tubular protein
VQELDAVNRCLTAISSPNVTALGASADANAAQSVVDEITIEVLATGWNVNTDIQVILPPDVNGKIAPPSNALVVDLANYNPNFLSTSLRVDPADGITRLWDRKNNTFVFGQQVKADLVYNFPFANLSFALQRYIAARSARVFQRRWLGAGAVDKFLVQEEEETFAALIDEEGEADNLNILTGNPHCVLITSRYNQFYGT